METACAVKKAPEGAFAWRGVSGEQACARYYGYALFSSVFEAEPTASLLQSIDTDCARMAWRAVVGEGAHDATVLDLFLCAAKTGGSRVDDLACEYTRLFVGPLRLPVDPWESVARSGERVLFTTTTLSVRNCYRASGFETAAGPQVADDHIALELAFMRCLAERAWRAAETGEGAFGDNEPAYGQLEDDLRASVGFLHGHLLTWLPHFAEQVASQSEEPFYRHAAQAAATFAQADARFLERVARG